MKARSQFTAIMMRLRKNKLAMLGLAILLAMAILALCADFIDWKDRRQTIGLVQTSSAETFSPVLFMAQEFP